MIWLDGITDSMDMSYTKQKKKKNLKSKWHIAKVPKVVKCVKKNFKVFLILCFYNKGEQKKVVGIQKF